MPRSAGKQPLAETYHELDREREDAVFLETVRRRAQVALSGLGTEAGE